MVGLSLIVLFGLGLIAAPIVTSILGGSLGGVATTLLIGSGIVISVLGVVLLTVTKLYVKTKASEAFVRTGWGGLRVIKDGGALVIPVVHQVVRVSLQTLRLVVNRENADALITSDRLRADVKAEFFVRVQPDDESIQAAARSFGDRMMDRSDEDQRSGERSRGYVAVIVEDKLVSALRTVAATMTLEALNTNRDAFVKQVAEILTHELAHNGLTLESVTISRLDQTDPRQLKDDNIFDAQGKRTIAEITQLQLTARNKLEREGEQARARQDVETRQQILALEQTKAEAEAGQAAAVAKIRAEKDREAREASISTERQVALAEVEKQKQLQVAERGQQQAVEVAEQSKVRAVEVAERERHKAVTEADQAAEVAVRVKEQAVTEAERERAVKETELATTEAEREAARQSIETVRVEAGAERDKKKRVIEATAEAERRFVETQRTADGEAYALKAKAEGQKAAADAEAEAITKKANAEAAAAKARATGSEAEQMVTVNVKKADADAEGKRVDVLKQELEAREAHGKSAQDFELAKFEIEKRAEVQIAAAGAMATVVGKVNATVFGTPENVAAMMEAMASGMGLSQTTEGFFRGAGPKTEAGIMGAAKTLQGLIDALAERLTPSESRNKETAGKSDGETTVTIPKTEVVVSAE